MNASTNAIIEARGLVKRFGETHALSGLDLSVAEGGDHRSLRTTSRPQIPTGRLEALTGSPASQKDRT